MTTVEYSPDGAVGVFTFAKPKHNLQHNTARYREFLDVLADTPAPVGHMLDSTARRIAEFTCIAP